MTETTATSMEALAEKLIQATNQHDLEALAGCFAADFLNETPVHPARSFSGSEQVRRNWAQIFGAIPDLKTTVLRRATAGDQVWLEWEMRGTRPDGAPHLMRGVTIFGFDAGAGRFAWVRFYMEPVQEGGPAIDQAVREGVGR